MIDLEVAPETLALVERLREVSIEETITYDDLSKVIGRDVRHVRHLLASARARVLKEHGILFGTERSVGLRRVAASEAHYVGQHARSGIRRKATRSAKQIRQAVSRANDMPPDATRKAYSEISTLGLIEHLASEKAQPKNGAAPDRPEPVGITAKRMLDRLTLRNETNS